MPLLFEIVMTMGPGTKSGAMRVGLVFCPCCNREGNEPAFVEGPCGLCHQARFVAVDTAIEWRRAHADTDPHFPAVKDPTKPEDDE